VSAARADLCARFFAGCVAALATLAASSGARAQQATFGVEPRRMDFAERSGNLAVTASFADILDRRARAELASGLATTLVLRVYVYRRRSELPVSFVVARIRLVYDLWDEVYIVRTEGPVGTRTRRYRGRADALRAFTQLAEFPVAPLERIAIGPHHFVAMVVELNPVSPELLAEVRRWLSKPAGDRGLDTGSSFFGSFVSVFSNPKLPEADAVLRLQSQPFFRVP
jgi:hypothetical protein